MWCMPVVNHWPYSLIGNTTPTPAAVPRVLTARPWPIHHKRMLSLSSHMASGTRYKSKPIVGRDDRPLGCLHLALGYEYGSKDNLWCHFSTTVLSAASYDINLRSYVLLKLSKHRLIVIISTLHQCKRGYGYTVGHVCWIFWDVSTADPFYVLFNVLHFCLMVKENRLDYANLSILLHIRGTPIDKLPMPTCSSRLCLHGATRQCSSVILPFLYPPLPRSW